MDSNFATHQAVRREAALFRAGERGGKEVYAHQDHDLSRRRHKEDQSHREKGGGCSFSSSD